jgi:hypothetical protein
MGYRGEDGARDRAAWGTQSPRQSSGQWPQADEYGNSTEQAGYDGSRHAGGSGYAAGDDYAGYESTGYTGSYPASGSGEYPASGYGPDGYGADGYSQDGYGQGNGYGQNNGYSQGNGITGSYPSYPAPTSYDSPGSRSGGGYSALDGPSGGYSALDGPSGGYSAFDGSSGGYRTLGRSSGGYPAQGGPSGGYPAQGGPSGGYRAITSGQGGGIPDAFDAGNDWYADGRATQGSGFADTSMQLAVRDPASGYPPEAGRPTPGVAQAGQQPRYDEDEYVAYPGYEGVDDGYGARQGYDDYDDYAPAVSGRSGPGGQQEYETRLDQPAIGYDSPRGYGQALQGDDFDGGLYRDDYSGDVVASPGTGRRGRGAGTGPRKPPRGGGAKGPRGKRGGGKVLAWALVIIVVGAAGFGGYKYLTKPKNSAAADVTQPLPTAGASSAAATAQCTKQFGPFCHIENRQLDPAALTTADLYPPSFFSEVAKAQFSRASATEDKDCSKAVIGADLTTQLKKGQCNQALRATYVSGDGTIMGTIGVLNLATTNQSHYAGKIIGKANFIMPLKGKTGPTAKLGDGTGVVEAQYKGHYLILIWAEFTSQKAPSTTALTQQLEDWENALVAGTANIVLSQRMINGDGPAASAPASASASSSAK